MYLQDGPLRHPRLAKAGPLRQQDQRVAVGLQVMYSHVSG